MLSKPLTKDDILDYIYSQENHRILVDTFQLIDRGNLKRIYDMINNDKTLELTHYDPVCKESTTTAPKYCAVSADGESLILEKHKLLEADRHQKSDKIRDKKHERLFQVLLVFLGWILGLITPWATSFISSLFGD